MATIFDKAEYVARDGVENLNGTRRLAFAGATPWHEFGQKASPEDARNVSKVRELSGVTWSVTSEKVYIEKTPNIYREVPNLRAFVRSIDEKVLGHGSATYKLVQPNAMDAALQALVDTGNARVDCIGSLNEGSLVFTTLALGGAEIIKGDIVDCYLLFSNAYDRTQSIRFGLVDERVVCQNSHRRALRSAGSKLLSFKHSGDVELKLQNAAKTIDAAAAQFRQTVASYKFLATRPFKKEQLDQVVGRLFPAPKKSEIEEAIATGQEIAGSDLVDQMLLVQESPKAQLDALLANTAEAQAKAKRLISELYDGGAKGSEIPGVTGTAWGAFNAVTEYLGQRGRTAESRVLSNLEGANAKIGDQALNMILEMVQTQA